MKVTYVPYEEESTTAWPSHKAPAHPSYEEYIKPGTQQGWICPRCGRVNAPWVMTCPCKSNAYIFKEEKPIVYTTTSVSSVPDPCKKCSNHPSNGGSGICHCTLGTQTIN